MQTNPLRLTADQWLLREEASRGPEEGSQRSVKKLWGVINVFTVLNAVWSHVCVLMSGLVHCPCRMYDVYYINDASITLFSNLKKKIHHNAVRGTRHIPHFAKLEKSEKKNHLQHLTIVKAELWSLREQAETYDGTSSLPRKRACSWDRVRSSVMSR